MSGGHTVGSERNANPLTEIQGGLHNGLFKATGSGEKGSRNNWTGDREGLAGSNLLAMDAGVWNGHPYEDVPAMTIPK